MRVSPLLVTMLLGCGAAAAPAPAPASASASAPASASASASASAPASAFASASASASAFASASASAFASASASAVDPPLLAAVKGAQRVAVVHVRNHHDFVAKLPQPGKHPSISLDVLRWVQGSERPKVIEARLRAGDPPLQDGAIYLLAFDLDGPGKALPFRLVITHAREVLEDDPLVDALAKELGAQPEANDERCNRAWFALDAIPKVCRIKQFTKDATPNAFTVRLSPSPAKVQGGDEVDVGVELVNTSQADATLVWQPGCVQLGAEAWRNGKRADWVNEGCGFGSGCGGYSARVTVVPGGKLETRVKLKTVVRKVQKSNCQEVDAGPFAPGAYELRLHVSPFFPLAAAIEKAKAPLTVTK